MADAMAVEDAPYVSQSKKKKKKRRKKLDVVMDFVPTKEGFSNPFVGYFPSGFDPEGCEGIGNRGEGETLKAIAYQNTERYKTRQRQLVVTPPQSSVDFIGTNYLGEGASWQPGNYALGVFDKNSKTLKLMPLGGAKVLRLEPRVRGIEYGDFLSSRTDGEVESKEMSKELMAQQRNLLTSTFGTHKDRVRLHRYERGLVKEDALGDKEEIGRLFEKAGDNPAVLTREEAMLQANAAILRNVPPYDMMATTPDRAYVFDKIVTLEEQGSLDDLQLLKEMAVKPEQLQEHREKKMYPAFVLNRLHKLRMEDTVSNKYAIILSYMRHLLAFYHLPRHLIRSITDPMGFHGQESASAIDLRSYANMPDAVAMKVLKLFTTFSPGEARVQPVGKRDLLIGYILVLGLMIDGFKADPYDLAVELKMTISQLRPYYAELGCKVKAARDKARVDPLSSQKLYEVVLPIPLQFPKLKVQSRRK